MKKKIKKQRTQKFKKTFKKQKEIKSYFGWGEDQTLPAVVPYLGTE